MKSLLIDLPSFFAKRNKIQSHVCEVVTTHSETPKSFDVNLRPKFARRSACWRCGKAISNEHSIHWGVGPDCAQTIGLPWEELPDDRPDIVKDIRVFLPKSFLSESELILLRSWVSSSQSEEKVVHQARLWIEDNRLYLESPYVNRSFIDDLKLVPGRKWHANVKANSFNKTHESIGECLSVLKRWQVVVNVDDSCTEMLNEHRARNQVHDAATKALGVESVDDIKYAEVDIDSYDWGLVTKPWLHQAQAILFTATVFGIQVKKKKR